MKLNRFLIYIFVFLSTTLFAQSVRSLNNTGVDKYEENNFTEAEVNFKKAIEENAQTFEAQFNLGSALYKQQRYDESIKNYQTALALAENDQQKARIYYNQGNALLKSQKIEESIEAYKEALKINPNDLEAKYNLSYALELLKNQQNQQQQNQDQNQDQNNKDQQQKNDQQQNQDQNKDQNKQDQQKQNQQDKNQQQQDQQQQQPQPKKDQISKEEAQRILSALKNNEAELQKELRKQKGKPVKSEKDW
jgi:tetratricopeptide (TPR) repeat protein